MISTLIIAACVALVGVFLLSGLVVLFDRYAPARFVRERHDLGLAVVLTLPLLFALACLPSPGSQTVPVPEYQRVQTEVTIPEIATSPYRDADEANQGSTAAGQQAGFTWQAPSALMALLLAVWACGTLIAAIRLIQDLRALQRLKSGARRVVQPAGLVLSRPVAIARTEAVALPLLAGFLRPVILLPVDFALNQDARPVLEHEIAHLVRHDAWIALATRLVTVIFWWAFPLIPLLPVIDRAREVMCDRRAARITGEPRRLASALLDAAEIAVKTPSLTLAAAPTRSGLAERIGQLTDPECLQRKDSLMRLSLILPAMIAGCLILTPRIGAAPADEPTLVSFVSGHGHRLDDDQGVDARLFRAAARGRTGQLVELLAQGADPNIRYNGDGTPLIAAARTGNARAVGLLLEAGARPDLGSPGDGTPLIAAADRGDSTIVELLLQAGADIDRPESGDGNPLIAASLRGRNDIVRRLLAGGADPNAYVPDDETPLINAAQAGRIDIAELLVAAGADVSLTVLARDRTGGDVYRSPLSEARRNRHDDMVRWLEARGAEDLPPQ